MHRRVLPFFPKNDDKTLKKAAPSCLCRERLDYRIAPIFFRIAATKCRQKDLPDFAVTLSLCAMLIRSANDSACILSINRPRCSLTVGSLMPIFAAICLLNRPPTTSPSTCCSRVVSEVYRRRRFVISASRLRASRSRSIAWWTASSRS